MPATANPEPQLLTARPTAPPLPADCDIDVHAVVKEFAPAARQGGGGADVVERQPAAPASRLYNRQVWNVAESRRGPMAVDACCVCGTSIARPTLDVERLAAQVVTCVGCGLGRLHPMPGPEDIAAFYPPAYYGSTGQKFTPMVESLVWFVAARHARFLARRLPAGGRVLDVGCGRGTLLSAFADRGFEVHGVEMSARAAEGADPRAQIRIAARLADARYPDCHFDQVVLWHVFEHLPDPQETLREIHRLLKPGGEVIIAVPNFASWQARWAGPAWFHLDLPRHLHHFPLPALKQLLARCGFACQSEHHFSLRQNPFGWVQSGLNACGKFGRNSLYEALHRGMPIDEHPGAGTDSECLADGGAPGHGASGLDHRHRRRGRGADDSADNVRGTVCTPGRVQSWLLKAAFFCGMPAAVLVEILAAVCRRGATIHVVARKAG